MSQANTSELPAPQCNKCFEVSTWSFIGEFYRRVELAHEYACRLEEDLSQTAARAQQSDATIARYEQSFSIVNSRLTDAQKSLEAEKKGHIETARLFEMAYEACTENSTIINNLRAEIADLQQGLALVMSAPTDQVHKRESSLPTIPLSEGPPNVILTNIHEFRQGQRERHQYPQGSTRSITVSPPKMGQLRFLNLQVVELTREAGYLRQELKFYRQCFDNSQLLRASFYNAYQQLFFTPTLLAAHNLQKLVLELHDALEDSIEKEVKAEKEWKEFWGLKSI
ncbi:hypothetical protein V496_00157 [Pseudogymnoascus sp. VKM F-4515 (FW-2607)]|nr:hypothetical protein V496_00157 [Pseudogymnoascus sp. VKM F-4515 (FW-2607)]